MPSGHKEPSYAHELFLILGVGGTAVYWLISGHALPFVITLIIMIIVGPPDDVHVEPSDAGIVVGVLCALCGQFPPPPTKEEPKPDLQQDAPPT